MDTCLLKTMKIIKTFKPSIDVFEKIKQWIVWCIAIALWYLDKYVSTNSSARNYGWESVPMGVNKGFLTPYFVHNLYARTLIYWRCFHANYWNMFYETARLLLLIKSRKILTIQKIRYNTLYIVLYRIETDFFCMNTISPKPFAPFFSLEILTDHLL